MTESSDIHAVFDFWFGDTGATAPSAADGTRWFGGGEGLDSEIREKFGHLLDADLAHWLDTPRGTVAYVVLHDQFPLNIYRRTAQAFAYEELAEQASLQAIDKGFDRGLGYGERLFLYMPLMHAEKLELQELSQRKFEELVGEVDEALREMAQGNLQFAQEHRDTVAKFGRFPFRNAVLGRQSSAEEQAYLDSDAPRYGQ